jgi:hypothetical protein
MDWGLPFHLNLLFLFHGHGLFLLFHSSWEDETVWKLGIDLDGYKPFLILC